MYYIIIFTTVALLACVGIYVGKLAAGCYNYTDQIISQETKTITRLYRSGLEEKYDITIFTIKRSYKSGKIDIITKRV